MRKLRMNIVLTWALNNVYWYNSDAIQMKWLKTIHKKILIVDGYQFSLNMKFIFESSIFLFGWFLLFLFCLFRLIAVRIIRLSFRIWCGPMGDLWHSIFYYIHFNLSNNNKIHDNNNNNNRKLSSNNHSKYINCMW